MKRTTTSRGRRTAAALLCAAFAASVAFPVGFAYANDNQNRNYSVVTSSNVTWTEAWRKDDCTSSWQNMKSLNIPSVESYIDAANSDGSPIEVNSPRYGWWQDKTGYMDNYVKENGPYNYAVLYFQAYTYQYGAGGQWSPDCIDCPPCG